MATWADIAARAERWLLPPACLSCRAPIVSDGDPLVCDVCCSRWKAISPPCCGVCGEPTPLGLECRVCAAWPPDFGPVRSAVRLDPAVRSLVHRFKYQGWWRLAEQFAVPMAALIDDARDVDLVPVPLARRRRRTRGYNQAERLARSIGKLTGLPVRPERLRRDRETPSQTSLTPEGRMANLAGAFRGSGGGRGVILVDDVFTTGATLCSAAAELLDGGAEQVGAITFARAELPFAGTTLPGTRRSL